MTEEGKSLIFRVQRYNPDQEGKPFLQEFSVPFSSGLTILEGLIYIKEHLDASLAYRASCRMGVCGSCAMFVNGFPRLACHTQIEELKSTVVEVRSLPNFPIIKDLVPDLRKLFSKHRSIRPYIIGNFQEIEQPTGEYCQTPEQLEKYLQFSYCLKCGICMAACPTTATDEEFLGPQALAQAYRYCADNRDGGFAERCRIVDNPHGIFRCHLAGACSEACPKGVDPALAIQLLKRNTVLGSRKLKLGRPAQVLPPQTGAKPVPNIAPAPERTVP